MKTQALISWSRQIDLSSHLHVLHYRVILNPICGSFRTTAKLRYREERQDDPKTLPNRPCHHLIKARNADSYVAIEKNMIEIERR
jgi:hypothetical protein